MRAIIATAIILSLSGAAYAQAPAINIGGVDKRKDPMKEMKDEEIDRAYQQATQGNKGAASAPNDPWASVRASEQPAKPAAKPAAKPKVQAQAQPPKENTAQSQSPWPAAPKPQSQAQSQSPWPPAPTQR
jgi:hypothetical protein